MTTATSKSAAMDLCARCLLPFIAYEDRSRPNGSFHADPRHCVVRLRSEVSKLRAELAGDDGPGPDPDANVTREADARMFGDGRRS